MQWLTEITWCNNQLNLNISKINKFVLGYSASNMNVAAHTANFKTDTSHTSSTWQHKESLKGLEGKK